MPHNGVETRSGGNPEPAPAICPGSVRLDCVHHSAQILVTSKNAGPRPDTDDPGRFSDAAVAYGSSRSTITTATVRRNPPLCRLAHWWRTPQHHQRRLRSTANTKLLSPERCQRDARSGARGVYFLDSAMALPGKTPNGRRAGASH